MRIIALIILPLAFLMAIPASNGASSAPVRVGVSLSSTGELSRWGGMYEKGLRLWAGDVNARGGILGRRVELVTADDASDPLRAASVYMEFAGGKADLLLGPVDNAAAMATLPALELHNVPCVYPMGASDQLWERGGGRAFGVLSPLSDWPGGFFEILSRAGVGSVAVMAVDHPRAGAILEIAAKWAKRYGLETTASLPVSSKELQPALENLKSAPAGALAVWGSREGCAAAVKALSRTPWTEKPLYVSSSLALSSVLSIPAKEMERWFTAVPWDIKAAAAFPGGGDFTRHFAKDFGHEPDFLAAAAYAGGQVLEAAAAKAGSLDKDKLRQALSQLDTLTILGRFGVGPTGMQLRQVPLTIQWQHGRREIVWPEELRTAKPSLAR